MTSAEARDLAKVIFLGLPARQSMRLKAIHLMPHLHAGHTTIRLFFYADTAPDPEPYIFNREELVD